MMYALRVYRVCLEHHCQLKFHQKVYTVAQVGEFRELTELILWFREAVPYIFLVKIIPGSSVELR